MNSPRLVQDETVRPTHGEGGARPGRAFPVLLASGTVVLLGVNLVAKLLTPLGERDRSSVLAFFDVNHETNVPTMWNGALLLAIALLCVAYAAMSTSGHPVVGGCGGRRCDGC